MIAYRRTSILDGISVDALRQQLAVMQKAYLDVSAGGKIEVASYTQGDGSKSITYTRANIEQLTQAILAVQTQIDQLSGLRINRRAPIVPRF